MNEWIDLAERHPEDKQRVKIKGPFPFEPVVVYRKYYNGGYEFLKTSSTPNVIHSFYGITHWKPFCAYEDKEEDEKVD